MDSRKTVRTSVSVSDEQYARLCELANKNDVSTAWVIRQAIQKYLDGLDNKQLPLPIKSDLK